MNKSFEERAKIWKVGGRGYWSRGDLSRIQWPENGYENYIGRFQGVQQELNVSRTNSE